MSEKRRLLNGREYYWLILQEIKTDKQDDSYHNYRAFNNLVLEGDNLEKYVNDWDRWLLILDPRPSERELEYLFT